MNLTELGDRIQLPAEAMSLIERCAKDITELEYQKIKQLFHSDRSCFYKEILSRDCKEAWFLYYYMRFACEAWETYNQRGISDKVFNDTFSDLTIWCQNCKTETGTYGLMEYKWLWRHVTLQIFRLGRLQYELLPAPKTRNIGGIPVVEGQILLNVHIPQGRPLDAKECDESLDLANQMFPEYRIFVCESWLLAPALKELMKETSNVIQFQNRYTIYDVLPNEQDAERRIFGKVLPDPKDYIAATSFQKRVKEYLIAGNKIGCGEGIFVH